MRVTEILLELKDADQLLISPDNLFRGTRMLNAEAEEFIIEKATMAGQNDRIDIRIHLQKHQMNRKDEIADAIHRHFAYRKAKSGRQLKKAINLGLKTLLISLVIFAVLILMTLAIIKLFPDGRVSQTFREILIIVGWVALWRPADLLLYEWRPFKREVRLFGKLEKCQVDIVAGNL